MANTRPNSKHDYEDKLERLLSISAEVFAAKGYHNASIRDISKKAGVSLSGLYYYFSSKDELLFKIQDRAFRGVIEELGHKLEGQKHDPEEKLRILIHNHVSFFAQDMASMKVISHEYDSLRGKYRDEIRALRLRYSDIVTEILREVRRSSGGGDTAPLNVATYALFGMMNWIYAWYRPGSTVSVDRLAEHLYKLFAAGFIGEASGRRGSRARVRN